MRYFAAFLLSLFFGVAVADDPVLVRQGDEFYLLQSGEGGPVLVGPLRLAVAFGGVAELPPPQPAPPRPDAPETELSASVKSWAKAENDPAGAGRLGDVYSQVADIVAAGEVSPQDAPAAVSAITERVVEGWDGFRDKIRQSYAGEVANGNLLDSESMSKWLREIASGLYAAGSPVSMGAQIRVTYEVQQVIGGSPE